jgi:hypothetical protein
MANTDLPSRLPSASPVAVARGGDVKFVSGVVQPHHRTSCRWAFAAVAPTLSLVGAAALYGLASFNSTEDHGDLQFLEPTRTNRLMAAAGFVGGALVLPVVAWGQYAYRRLSERCVARCSDEAASTRLIRHAVSAGPLTLGGLKLQIKRLEHVHQGDPAGLASALAALGKAISLEAEGCCPSIGEVSVAQLNAILEKLKSLGTGEDCRLDRPTFFRALLTLAANLQRSEPLNRQAAEQLRVSFLSAASAIDHVDPVQKTEALLDFSLELSRSPLFKDFHLAPYKYQEGEPDKAPGFDIPTIQSCMPRRPDRDAKQEPSGASHASVLTKEAVVQQLAQTPVDQLHAKVGFALGIALRPDLKASERADYLIAIQNALTCRDDLRGGMFLPGLLTPQEVNSLSEAIVNEPELAPKDKATRMVALPRLCQYQIDAALIQVIEGRLKKLGNVGSISVSRARIAPTGLGLGPQRPPAVVASDFAAGLDHKGSRAASAQPDEDPADDPPDAQITIHSSPASHGGKPRG